MISLEASPRSPRVVAEQMMRRARETGDLEMWNRGKRAMQYAEDLEARRPSEINHGPIDRPGDKIAREIGQVVGFVAPWVYFGLWYYGLLPEMGLGTISALLSFIFASTSLLMLIKFWRYIRS